MTRPLSVLSVLLWHIQQCKLRLSPFEQHGVPFPHSCRKRYTPDKYSCRQPPISVSASFWVSFCSPTADTDRHCRQVWQGADYLSRTAGTLRRTSVGLSAEARPPAASSWCVQNTFHPVTTYAHIPHTGNVFPSASLQNTSCIAPPSQMAATDR